MSQLNDKGCEIIEGYFDAKQCQEILGMVADYRKGNKLTEIHRPMKPRPLRYKVIDGDLIKNNFAYIWELYQGPMLDLARQQSRLDINLLDNEKVGVNINIMAPQVSAYRWHYDRNMVTAILYLNTVEGGETVLFPNYRILLNKAGGGFLQQSLDKLIHIPLIRSNFTERWVVKPEAGKLVMMKGKRCWHSVRPLQGKHERINIIFAYDLVDGSSAFNQDLDRYLYSSEESASADPNYKQ